MNGFILHLQGPMMSFGDTGFGQLRDAGPGPSRSAVLGAVAAAIGIERGEKRLLELHREIRVHVGVVMSGAIAVDYHTIATAGYAQYDPAQLRRLGIANTNPVLTSRAYHMDAHFVALLTSMNQGLLDECRKALRHPVYTAYLGRRSCPPATPLLAEPAQGSTLSSALCEAFCGAYRKRVESRPSWQRRSPEYFDAFLDGEGELDRNETGIKIVASSYRRDLLVALPRSYINRSMVHVRIPLPVVQLMTNEEIFNATP